MIISSIARKSKGQLPSCCFQVTLELSCCKYPPAGELPRFWEDNKGSLMQFIGEAHRGVRGFVKDLLIATPIEGASMKVRKKENMVGDCCK